jgi:hypothetical protein
MEQKNFSNSYKKPEIRLALPTDTNKKNVITPKGPARLIELVNHALHTDFKRLFLSNSLEDEELDPNKKYYDINVFPNHIKIIETFAHKIQEYIYFFTKNKLKYNKKIVNNNFKISFFKVLKDIQKLISKNQIDIYGFDEQNKPIKGAK